MKKLRKIILASVMSLALLSPITTKAIETPATNSVWVEGHYSNKEEVIKDNIKGYNLTNTSENWVLNLSTTKEDGMTLKMAFDLKNNYTISIKNTDSGQEYNTADVNLNLVVGTNKFDIIISDTDGTTEHHTLTVNLTHKTASDNPDSGAFLNIGLIGGTALCFGVIYFYQKKKSKFYKI